MGALCRRSQGKQDIPVSRRDLVKLTAALLAPANAAAAAVRGGQDLLPTGSPIVVVGDSIDQSNFNTGPTPAVRQSGKVINIGSGEVVAALAMDPRASLMAWNDVTDDKALLSNAPRYYSSGAVGRAGAVSPDIIAEIPRAAAYLGNAAGLGILGGGTNYLGLSDAAFYAAKLAEIDALHAALPHVPWGVCTVRAVGASQIGLNGRTVANIAAKNAQIAAAVAARSSFCSLIDLSAYADDPARPGQGLDINFATNPYQSAPGGDGLHPGLYGVSQKGGPAIAAFVRAHVLSGNAFVARRIASVLPTGVPLLLGSSPISHTATAGGGTVTGVVAANIDVVPANANASNIVCSLEGNAETGGQTLVLTVFPAGSASKELWSLRLNPIGVTTTALQNKWSRTWFEIEVDQWAGWLQVGAANGERSDFANNQQAGLFGIYPLGSGRRRLYPHTAHLQYGATSSGCLPSLNIQCIPSVGGGPGVIKLRQWDVQIEASPVRP